MCVCGRVSISNNHHLWTPSRYSQIPSRYVLCQAPLYNVNLCEVSGVHVKGLRPTVMS